MMYASIRRYAGAQELADELGRRSDEIETLLRGVSGFLGYCLVKTGDGMTSVTVCEDRAGAEESNNVAREWLAANLPQMVPSPPEVSGGEITIFIPPD
jgi:hypothetical protein